MSHDQFICTLCLTWYVINISERVKRVYKKSFWEINFTHLSQLCRDSFLYRIINGISRLTRWVMVHYHLAIDSRPSQINPGVFRFKLTTSSSTQIAELVILYGPRYGRSMRSVSITRYSKYYRRNTSPILGLTVLITIQLYNIIAVRDRESNYRPCETNYANASVLRFYSR